MDKELIKSKLGYVFKSVPMTVKQKEYLFECLMDIVNGIINNTDKTNESMFIVVNNLPTTDIKENKIYLLPVPNSSDNDEYSEYVYKNNRWEKLGNLTGYETSETTQSKIDSSNKELTSKIEKVEESTNAEIEKTNNIIYSNLADVKLIATPNIIEKGVNTTIKLSYTFKLGDGNIPASEVTIVKTGRPGTTVYNNTDVTNDSSTYLLSAKLAGVTKTASCAVVAYYPMYFGSINSETITETNILDFTKQSIKSSPNGNYSMNVNQEDYVWLCIPNTMNINKVVSSGFEVPFEEPIIINVSNKDNYKCYRSTSKFNSGEFVFNIQ